MRNHVWAPLLCLAVVAGANAQDTKAPSSPELLAATAKAKVHNQRVLAILTDKDRDVAAMLKKNAKASKTLMNEFATVQLRGEQADAMAVHWKMPDALQAKPALAVLDADGKLLATLAPADFMVDGAVAGPALLEKLKPLHCAPVDAEAKLTQALAQGKQDGRAVFVRFDAPW